MSEQSPLPYHRIDLQRLSSAGDNTSSLQPTEESAPSSSSTSITVRWWIIPLSMLLCVVQAVATVLAANLTGTMLTPTMISVVAFGMLFFMVVLLNPMLRLVFRERLIKPLKRAELMCVFTAMLVTSGISTFGLTEQLVPMIAAPWNEEWNTPQRGWDDEILPHLNPSLYIAAPPDASPEQQAQALENIRNFRQGLRPVDAHGDARPRPPSNASWKEQFDYWRAVFQQVPWAAWLRPLAGWLVFIGACYALFYSLTYFALGSWVHREKLIFPLAQLPEQLLPEDGQRQWLPAVMRTSGFWIAFGLIFALLSWNGAVAAEWIPGLGRINLGMAARDVGNLVSGTVYEGLDGGPHPLKFIIIFTAIGVAFLLPAEVSFSLWFYFLVGKAIILGLTWVGHGQSGDAFPSDWFLENNTVTAQGGGALLAFAAVSLGRAGWDLVHMGRGQPLGQKVRLCIPVAGLVVSLTTIFLWLQWNHLNFFWALITMAVITLITLGMMRAVAEGGIYWFQIHTSPSHLFNQFGLGHVFTPATAMAPLIPIYYVLFFDVKTFLAPNLANAAKMREDTRASRIKFHLNIILCLAVSVVVAIGFAIFLAHLIGAQQMSGWFYNSGPPWALDAARDILSEEPAFNTGNALSYCFGAAWVVFSVLIRSTLFWFPHPIGYVMLVNPLMATLWFNFFLGWTAKKFVIRYGGKSTFEIVRPIFIGIIMGELMAILLWSGLGIAYDFSPGVTLNRTNP